MSSATPRRRRPRHRHRTLFLGDLHLSGCDGGGVRYVEALLDRGRVRSWGSGLNPAWPRVDW